jgi:hypothetical protein
MMDLVIQFKPSAPNSPCTLCGDRTSETGPQLYRADRKDLVCRACGKKHAPSLAALLELACTAERVGRIGRHTLVPPLTALLDLARAAEDYSQSTPAPFRKAG